jgi:hypothetical protein
MKKKTRGMVAVFLSILLVGGVVSATPDVDATSLGSLPDLTRSDIDIFSCATWLRPPIVSTYHPSIHPFNGRAIVHATGGVYPIYQQNMTNCAITGYWAGGNLACSWSHCAPGIGSTYQPPRSAHWFVCWADSSSAGQYDLLSLQDSSGHYLVGWFPDSLIQEFVRYGTYHC